MSEKEIGLSGDELESLLGNLESDEASADSREESSKVLFRRYVTDSVIKIKEELSRSLGEEVELSLGDIDELHGIEADMSSEWYVAQGSFTNNGRCEHAFVFPSDVALEIVKQFSNISDMENTVEQIEKPLTKICNGILGSIKGSYGSNFFGVMDDFTKVVDLSRVDPDHDYLRITWKLGEKKFYEFFGTQILHLISEKKKEDPAVSLSSDLLEEDAAPQGQPPPIGADLASLLGEGAGDSGGDSLSSLGEELLRGDHPVSGVELQNLESGTDTSGKKELDILMDVSMEVTVELGHTKMRIREILEMNRGSIIELRKLAGEPLDIKVNQKLLAKGEVVIIDENFGVRIIEVISSHDRSRQMN